MHPRSAATTGSIGVPQDVAGLQPPAREIAEAITRVCVDALGNDLETLLFHGSAVKGGIIEGSSDVDFVQIVRRDILTPGNELPLDRAIAFHRQLVTIDPAPFRYLQGHICSRQRPPGLGFVPGTYVVATGSHDVPLATSAQLLAAAVEALANLDRPHRRDRLSNALLNHGENRLDREVRWLCTDVWPVSFQIACLVEGDGVKAWQRNKLENVKFLRDDPIVGSPLRHWLEVIRRHYATGEGTDSALDAIVAGSAFLDAAADWFQHYRSTPSAEHTNA